MTPGPVSAGPAGSVVCFSFQSSSLADVTLDRRPEKVGAAHPDPVIRKRVDVCELDVSDGAIFQRCSQASPRCGCILVHRDAVDLVDPRDDHPLVTIEMEDLLSPHQRGIAWPFVDHVGMKEAG